MGRFDARAAAGDRTLLDVLKWRMTSKKASAKGFSPPQVPYDRAIVNGEAAHLTWLGHASFLMRLGGQRLLFDPVLSSRVGPVPRLAPPGVPLEELPPIDVVMVSHNHRDHMDAATLERLGKRPTYVVPLGNRKTMEGIGAETIVELDWWESTNLGALTITCVPAKHWSMRLPWDRNDSLWGGFVVKGPEGAAYHSGDTGYFEGFREIGERCGPIDWAMLPIGAYEPRWFMSPQHMGADEAARAAKDLGAKHFVTMHWGTFQLTDEPLDEPPKMALEHHLKLGGTRDSIWQMAIGESRLLQT